MSKPSQQDLRVFNDSFQRCKESWRFFELFGELRDGVREKRDWRLSVYAVMLAVVTGDSRLREEHFIQDRLFHLGILCPLHALCFGLAVKLGM